MENSTNKKVGNGIFNHAEIKELFKRQWVNGNLTQYMENVKRRVKEMFDIDLVFNNQDEFLSELIKHKLIDSHKKGSQL